MNINWEELSKKQATRVVKDLLKNNLTEKEEIKDLLASYIFMSSSVIMSDKIAIMKKMLEVVSLKQDTDLLAEIIFGLDKQKAFSLFTTSLKGIRAYPTPQCRRGLEHCKAKKIPGYRQS